MTNIISSDQVQALVHQSMTVKADTPAETGTITALSYRTLRVVESHQRLDIATGNSEFDSGQMLHYRLETGDGVTVHWYRGSLGIVSGENFLPAAWYDLPWRLVLYDLY